MNEVEKRKSVRCDVYTTSNNVPCLKPTKNARCTRSINYTQNKAFTPTKPNQSHLLKHNRRNHVPFHLISQINRYTINHRRSTIQIPQRANLPTTSHRLNKTFLPVLIPVFILHNHPASAPVRCGRCATRSF